MSQEKRNKNDSWNPTFHQLFKGYQFLADIAEHYWKLQAEFPTIDQYNQWALDFYQIHDIDQVFHISFITQDNTRSFEQTAFDQKAIMTRPNHWHDFFNNWSWILWPQLKWSLICKYHQENRTGSDGNTRTLRQSFIAQLDECGIIICSAEPMLVQSILQHDWRNVFYTQRGCHHALEVFIFGHGLLEKALHPFVGMTGKALIIPVSESYFSLALAQRIKFTDAYLASFIQSPDCFSEPKTLQPFPILGMPGWYENNESPDFFDQSHYFRPKRNAPLQSAALTAVVDKSLLAQSERTRLQHWLP